MHTMRQLTIWLCRAWPVLILLPLAALHAFALSSLPSHTVVINKLTGTVLQILGGLIVLHAVDGNLGLFRKQTIASVVLAWLRDFPLFRRHVVIALSGIASSSAVGSASLSVRRAANTIEERIAEVERQLEEVRIAVREQGVAVHRRIDEVKTELSASIASNEKAVNQLSAQLETATVGGFKQQAFGVMLAIYGAVVGVFA
jgi:hypothetical protein